MRALVCPSREDGVREVPLPEVLAYRDNPAALLWLDFCQLNEADVAMLQAEFGFHELALEDAIEPHDQRSKVEEYDDHFFMVMHSLEARPQDRMLTFERRELDLFVGHNYVVSIHRDEIPELETVWSDALKRPTLVAHGADRLAYHLMDRIVDRYLEATDKIEDVIDYLEDRAVEEQAGESSVQEIFGFKRELIRFRKASGPLRDAIGELTSLDFPAIKPETMPYLRDVYDHLIRLADILDTYRDILGGALDVHLAAVSNRLNDIMKRLTLVATVFMPLTFITGFWGMNFTRLPFGSSFWYWGSLAIMVVTVLWMAGYFWRKKWL
ncbi:MAG: magnesium/cobalt transporter CorA [Thermoleophilia bacterium]